MSGPGKEEKPGKDYWKTGDPNLRAKVISSVGVALIVMFVAVGATPGVMNEPRPVLQPSPQPSPEEPDILPIPRPPPEEPESNDDQGPPPEEPESNDDPVPPPEGLKPNAPPASRPQPAPPHFEPSEPNNVFPSTAVSLAFPLLFIGGIILVIIGIVLYLRRRKKAFP